MVYATVGGVTRSIEITVRGSTIAYFTSANIIGPDYLIVDFTYTFSAVSTPERVKPSRHFWGAVKDDGSQPWNASNTMGSPGVPFSPNVENEHFVVDVATGRATAKKPGRTTLYHFMAYFYNRTEKLRHLKESDESRAEVCMEIEEDLLKLYSDESVITKPALLDLRGGHKYSLAAVSLIDSIANDKKDVHIVNIKNNGALEFMDDDDIVEIAAIVGKDGAVPIPADISGSRHIIGLMRIVKEYEKLTVDAGRTGNNEAALNALMLHPLVGDFENAKACFEEMKEAHKEYLPQFSV